MPYWLQFRQAAWQKAGQRRCNLVATFSDKFISFLEPKFRKILSDVNICAAWNCCQTRSQVDKENAAYVKTIYSEVFLHCQLFACTLPNKRES